MQKLVLLRHGQSVWNQENRFPGWTDVDLSPQGRQEAARAGQLLRTHGYGFEVGFTSVLKRAIKTLGIALEEMDLLWIPVQKAWRLNKRFYGALQGLNKAETSEKFGAGQVQRWRRDPHARPPALTRDDPRFPGHDARYQHLTARERPFWTEQIMGAIRANQRYSCAPTATACGRWCSTSTT